MQNVLIVSRATSFHNKSGGMETQLMNLVESLKESFNITVLTTSKSIDQVKNISIFQKGVRYIYLGNTLPGENGYSLYEKLFWQIPVKRNFETKGNFRSKAAKYYSQNFSGKFDFIVSQSSAVSDFKIDKNKTKLLLIYHGTTLNEIISRFRGITGFKDNIRFFFLDIPILLYEYLVKNPILFSKASKIILVSKSIEKDFKKQYSYVSKKCVVINNGVDTDTFLPLKKSKKLKVIYFGRINFEKGLDSFINVAKKIPNADFTIYGSGTDKEELISLLNKEILPNIKYAGEVSNSQIAAVLGSSHVFLFLTKRKEGFPMSIIEALSCGVITVSTLNIKELDPNFPYIQVSSVDSAVKELNKLLDYSTFSKLSLSCRSYAKKHYALSLLGHKYKEIFLEK